MQATFSSAFLRGEPKTAGLLTQDFRDRETRQRAVQAAAERPVSPRLIAALQAQTRALPESEARHRNLDALATPGTCVVVTGQQVGLFLGPLFTLYKAASAVAAARALSRETGVRCVPLFWLQTEDHDFAEVNHCHVPRPGQPPLRLEIAAAPDEDRVSMAHRKLGDGVTAQLALLRETLESLPHSADFLRLLAAHYHPDATFGGAFAGLLAELFSDEGLLILDPRCADIAELAAPVYRQSLLQHEACTATLCARTAALREAGFDEQVHVRPSTALLFLHDATAGGPRYRPERKESGWWLPASGPERQISDGDLLAILEREPLRFSTSALLRPLVQDTLLPTAAYIGGPGEINYLVQLPPLYALLGVRQPLFMPRARFRCLEDNARSLLQKLELSPADAELPRSELLRRVASRTQSAYPTPESIRGRILDEATRCLSEIGALDPTLRDPVNRTRTSIEHNVDRFLERYRKTLCERDHVTTDRIDRLQQLLFPDGAPQERIYSLPYFACKYGSRAFTQKVLDAIGDDPFPWLAQGSRDLLL
jgi:bacillithiol biosynthesis cysteine-adding enzyme BshC